MPIDTSKNPMRLLQGQAGNYRVASELLLRGMNVMFPAVDTGIDLLVESRVRVQVKSAHATVNRAHAQALYGFFLAKGPKPQGGQRSTKCVARVFSNTCDIVVLWGIEENRFWIVPAHLLDNRFSIVLGNTGTGAWVNADMESIRQLRLQGLTCEQIADKLSMSTMTVSRRLRGMFLEANPNPLIHQVRQYEGRWDLIESYYQTLQSANVAAATPVETL